MSTTWGPPDPPICRMLVNMSANPSIVTWVDSRSTVWFWESIFWVMMPFDPIFMVADPSAFLLMRIGPSGPSIFISPGWSGALSSMGGGAAGESFSFGPSLPTTSASSV